MNERTDCVRENDPRVRMEGWDTGTSERKPHLVEVVRAGLGTPTSTGPFYPCDSSSGGQFGEQTTGLPADSLSLRSTHQRWASPSHNMYHLQVTHRCKGEHEPSSRHHCPGIRHRACPSLLNELTNSYHGRSREKETTIQTKPRATLRLPLSVPIPSYPIL